MPDYPVLNALGQVIVAWPYDPMLVIPERAPRRDPGPDYPVLNAAGEVIVALPYETYVPPGPHIDVEGGTVTTFTRGGVDYTQILFRGDGTLRVRGSVACRNGAGAGGGGSEGAYQNGGSSGGQVVVDAPELAVLQEGTYEIKIGKGGTSASGGPTTISFNGTTLLTCLGGLRGRGNAVNGESGYNGSGAGGGGTGTPTGGAGSNHKGGNGFSGGGVDTERAGGGGAGQMGDGQDASSAKGGDGGAGVYLDFMDPPTGAGGGGGGGARISSSAPGQGTHGGTNGTAGAVGGAPAIADWSGGSGGSGWASFPGTGGDGFFVIVFESSNAGAAQPVWLVADTGVITTDGPVQASIPMTMTFLREQTVGVRIDSRYIKRVDASTVTLEVA